METIKTVETIDVTPTWSAILPMLLTVIEHGSREGRRSAIEELSRMATAADAWNEAARKAEPVDPFDGESAAKEQSNG